MKVLVVHAHHEPQSFSSALYRQAVHTLSALGHEVAASDLYAMRFDPVSDRRNFTSVHDPGYLKQQREERHASDVGGFVPELEAEIRKLEACDLLLFNFPLWWFALPAILKGWVDRVFAMRRVYGDGKLYENGLGQARRRAMVIMTAGAGADAYGGFGPNPALEQILAPIEHGIFWFNGFLPLDAFVVWSPARLTPEQRSAELARLDQRLRGLDQEKPRRLAPLGDFPNFGKDRLRRFMVTITSSSPLDTAQSKYLGDLKREGIALATYTGEAGGPAWRAFVLIRERDAGRARDLIRERDAGRARDHLDRMPARQRMRFEIAELAQL